MLKYKINKRLFEVKRRSKKHLIFLHALIKECKLLFENSVHFLAIASFPIMFGLISISEIFIPVFLGAGYDSCIDLTRIFSLLIVLMFLLVISALLHKTNKDYITLAL